MSLRFDFEGLPGRIVFGAGRFADVPAEVERLGGSRVVLFASGRDLALDAALRAALGGRLAGRVDGVRQHVPQDGAEAARARVAEIGGDLLLAVGGGSAIGLAKAVALTTGLPIVAVPTTYAGSEMTPIWGVTAGSRKRTGRDLRVLPRTVVYDPELTVGLPPGLSAASGMNALAHCVEALWVPAANPITGALADRGIRVLARALPRVVSDPGDLDARADALHGASLAGMALAAVGTGLHHKLAHVLGGTFDLPHADVHAVLLPYTTALCAAGAPDVLERISGAMEAADAAGGLWDLGRAVGAPPDLAALGLDASQASEAAGIIAEGGAWPKDAVAALLDRARTGRRP